MRCLCLDLRLDAIVTSERLAILKPRHLRHRNTRDLELNPRVLLLRIRHLSVRPLGTDGRARNREAGLAGRRAHLVARNKSVLAHVIALDGLEVHVVAALGRFALDDRDALAQLDVPAVAGKSEVGHWLTSDFELPGVLGA